MSNWNICEDFYPGPVVEGIDLWLNAAGEYSINTNGSHSVFRGTVASLPTVPDPSVVNLINKWVTVWSRTIIVFEGYLNEVEYESGFFNGKTEIKITVTSKQVDLNYG